MRSPLPSFVCQRSGVTAARASMKKGVLWLRVVNKRESALRTGSVPKYVRYVVRGERGYPIIDDTKISAPCRPPF